MINPPIKCQGRKTSLVGEIKSLANTFQYRQWIEPFCGSCAAAFNIEPTNAILCDANPHIIKFYNDLKDGHLDVFHIKEFLECEGDKLKKDNNYYYIVRERFNDRLFGSTLKSLDFLFLNRSCYNGLMRFNNSGSFNTPYCKVPHRFTDKLIDRILRECQMAIHFTIMHNVSFIFADFHQTIFNANEEDLIYADPPYIGRNTQYHTGWSESDEKDLSNLLLNRNGPFILSTWLSANNVENQYIDKYWSNGTTINTVDHYYKVGPKVSNRYRVKEALISRK